MSAHSNYLHMGRKLGLALVGVVLTAGLPLAARASTIGLYTDESGSSCSFSGNNAGVFTAYVVVKPDDRGLHGVRFSAPVPSCLGATFVEALKPLGGETIGEPDTGISVAWGTCQTETALALTISYYRNSSTEPCCAFPITEDTYVHMIEGVDCNHVSYEVQPIVSHFNADAACACNDAAPPSPPRVALPANGSTSTIVSTKLEWTTWVRDTDVTSFDLYFGLNPDPAFKTSLTARSYQPATLQPLTQYYWRVVAHDSEGLETSSPVWTFTTRPVNSAPAVVPVAPFSGATDIARAALLQWSPYDIDGDAMHFDIYLGTESDPPLFVSGRTDTTFTTPELPFSTVYYWKVVVSDTHGHTSAGPVSSFTTRPENFPPFAASLPAPAGNTTMQPISLTLRWAAGEPDPADALTFDVYFGTSSTPPLVASNVTSQSLAKSGLAYATKYYWRVVSRDDHGAEKTGPVWFFTTRPQNLPPDVPSSPTPANNVGGISMTGSLEWSCSDPEGQAVSYDVYLGLSMTPPLVGHTTTTHFNYAFQVLGHYYWRIVAKDASGNETGGPVWSFVTSLHPTINTPPLLPSKPSPADASTNQALDVRLTWNCSDPDHNALSYDVYLGTGGALSLVAAKVKDKYYEPATLAPGTSYQWQVVARDLYGAETQGPVWSFETLAVSNLSAVATGEDVQVAWRLAGIDGMESYTLLRTKQGGIETAVVAQGAVTKASGSFLDTSVEYGAIYQYSLSVHVASGDDIRSSTATVRARMDFVLGLNHPNPFNPQTTIPYSLSWGTWVRLAIYDASGRLVRVLVDERQSVGQRSVVWDGQDAAGRAVASGVYFSVLEANNERRTRKMVLLK